MMRTMAAAAVAAVLLQTGAQQTGAASKSDIREAYEARYRSIAAEDVVWGNESGYAQHRPVVGRIDPPYFTQDPNRVEVVALFRYTGGAWAAERVTRAWEASLPEDVYVLRMPMGDEFNENSALAPYWKAQQELFFAGQMLGIEEQVHKGIGEIVDADSRELQYDWQVETLEMNLGLAPGTLNELRGHPTVQERATNASWLSRDSKAATDRPGWNEFRAAVYPVLVINGRTAIDGTFMGPKGNPTKLFRVANRMIREALEEGRAHDGPTNDEELASWLTPRAGEVFSRVKHGERRPGAMLYNPDRKEVWGLNKDGTFKYRSPLRGKGDDAYWQYIHPTKGVQRKHVWMRARQYVSFKNDEGAPQRYGAWLFKDWLIASDRVELPFMGTRATFRFWTKHVEARSGEGEPVQGLWWLEAGDLKLAMKGYPTRSYPWQQAAAHAGFEVPQESLTPWTFEAERENAERRARAAETAAQGDRGR